MLSFFKKAVKTAVIVASRVFVSFDRIVLPGILDDTSASYAFEPQLGSLSEGIASASTPLSAMKTSTKPLCECGLLAPSDGLGSMTNPIHAIGLRITHPDIFVPFEKTQDSAVMTQCFQAIA